MISTGLSIKTLSLADLTDLATLCAKMPELNWSAGKLKASLAETSTLAIGLMQGGVATTAPEALLGFALVQYAPETAELLLIAVAKEYQRRGYGTHLCRALIARLQAEHVAQLFLEVRISNHAALKLYQKLGFQGLAVRKNYYPTAMHGVYEDASVLCLDLN